MTKEIEKAIKLVEKYEAEIEKAEEKVKEDKAILANLKSKLMFAQKDLAMLIMFKEAGNESISTFARRMEADGNDAN